MTIKRAGNNPWVTRALSLSHRYWGDDLYYDEYREADERPPKKCPKGHRAWFKPTVGGYVCPTCGMVECQDGIWRHP